MLSPHFTAGAVVFGDPPDYIGQGADKLARTLYAVVECDNSVEVVIADCFYEADLRRESPGIGNGVSIQRDQAPGSAQGTWSPITATATP